MKYIGMPMGMWVLFSKSFRDKLISVFGYRGLQNWETEQGFLRDTCGLAQDRFRQVLEYFKITA